MNRRFAVAFASLTLGLLACRNEDAYLGGSHEAYRCQTRCELGQGVPRDAGDWFFNPETELGEAPEILYPLSEAVHPRDLRELTVQFRRGRADFQVFRVRIEDPDSGIGFDFFTPCLSIHDDGCRYLLKGGVWEKARNELLGKSAVLTVTGATALHGVLKTSKPVAVNVVESNLGNKGFYYWTTVPVYSGDNDSETGIYRLPFGADQAEPFIMPNTPTNGRQCGACHSVSRDGSTIAFTARNIEDGPADQRSGSLVTTLTARPQNHVIESAMPGTYDSSMMALSGNGKRVLVAFDDQLVLRSSEPTNATFAAGEVIASLTRDQLGGKVGFFPEFSPEDDAVVLTLSDQQDSAIAVQAGDIAVLDVDLAKSTFGTPRTIVEGNADLFHFYPTWSPDGKFVAFASSPRGEGEDGNPRKSYDQKMARLRLVRREGGTVYELGNATRSEGKWSTYPKFAPFQSGSLAFLTFNSKISYGLIQDNESKADKDRVAQLWMSAVDVSKLPEDPSSPPIWLPFQDASQPGHLGLWTNDVKCRTDVDGTGCAFGQKCVDSVCKVEPK
jgi:Tol biopolymer transport system component